GEQRMRPVRLNKQINARLRRHAEHGIEQPVTRSCMYFNSSPGSSFNNHAFSTMPETATCAQRPQRHLALEKNCLVFCLAPILFSRCRFWRRGRRRGGILKHLRAEDRQSNPERPAHPQDSNMLFIGGLMLAISVEFWNLSFRMAVLVLPGWSGVQPAGLLLGFMLPTLVHVHVDYLTHATAAMMLPIVDAVLQELMVYDQLRKAEAAQAAAMVPTGSRMSPLRCHWCVRLDGVSVEPKLDQSHSNGQQPSKQQQQQPAGSPCCSTFNSRRTLGMLTIAVAYSANYGGTPTLTGTRRILVLTTTIWQPTFGNKTPFNFGSWFLFAFPISISCLLLAWIHGCSSSSWDRAGSEVAQYEKLGPITFPEVSCIILFGATVLLWISRTGWSPLVHDKDQRRRHPSVRRCSMSILLFACCRREIRSRGGRRLNRATARPAKEDETAGAPQASTLLTWQAVPRAPALGHCHPAKWWLRSGQGHQGDRPATD
uniref:PhoLip_ATPase_C domain-containing protein n=1 Tax=Macrostomum lignano TaxID=282301 RepID=A0A1I8FL67_9PLAT